MRDLNQDYWGEVHEKNFKDKSEAEFLEDVREN